MLRVKLFLQDMFFYTTHVAWEGLCVQHLSWTRREAMQWMACYPATARVTVTHGPDIYVVARRGHL